MRDRRPIEETLNRMLSRIRERRSLGKGEERKGSYGMTIGISRCEPRSNIDGPLHADPSRMRI